MHTFLLQTILACTATMHEKTANMTQAILACIAIACENDNIVNILLSLQGHLFRAAFLRHVPLFVRNLSENVVLCLVAATVESTARTILAHMELAWRNSLTNNMHNPYFENMVRHGLLVCQNMPTAALPCFSSETCGAEPLKSG